jgi:hypothetical protein
MEPRAQISKIPMAVWLLPSAMLVIALARLPYGYYTLTRIVVCAACALLCFVEATWNARGRYWLYPLAAVAVLYNPLVPIHFSRHVWVPINLLTMVVILVHFWTVARGRGRK